MAAGSAVGCRSESSPRIEPGSLVARIGVPEAEVSTADIGLRQAAAFLTTEGLTAQQYDGRVRPSLAARWTSTGDGLTWRFTLQKGITFHDGTAGTATVMADALRTAFAARALREARPGLADIVAVDAVGSDTIEIRLRRRSTFLLEDVDFAITRAADDRPRVGTGPFKAASETASEILLDAHKGYHHEGRPQLDRVIVRAYSTLRTAWAAMMRGEIDVLYDVPRDAVEFAGSSDVALYSYLRHYVYLVAFNGARPLFKPTPVRRALNAAIDRDALIKSVLRGQGAPASGPFWPLHWAFDTSLPRYAYDPSLAGAALDAAGRRLVTAPDGRRSRMRFTCILPANWVMWERIALNVQKQLYDIGVDMQLQVLPETEFNQRIRAGNFDAVMLEMRSGPFLSRPYVYWRWGGEQTEYNVFGYRSAAADRWFEGIRAAVSDAEYRAAAALLQRAMLDDPPALFLAWTQRTRAVNRRFVVPVDATRDPMPSFSQWRASAAR